MESKCIVFEGNFLTQLFSVILTTSGIFLLAFSTWQFGITEPHCCYGNVSDGLSSSLTTTHHLTSGNCSELHKEVILHNLALGIPESLLIGLALLGLVVRENEN